MSSSDVNGTLWFPYLESLVYFNTVTENEMCSTTETYSIHLCSNSLINLNKFDF